MVSEKEAIDIAVLAIYILLFPFSVFVASRHGFWRSIGFLYLCLFCLIRIASSAMGIVSENNPNSDTDAIWAAVLGSVGISPLLLASFGIISRVNKNSTPRSNFRILAAEILHFPNILALVLAIVGGNFLESDSASKRSSGQKFSQSGIIIFMVVYACYIGLCALTTMCISAIPLGERRLLYAALMALPFIFTRILYSVFVFFVRNDTFNLISEDPNNQATAQLCMALIEEIIVVVIYIGGGMIAPVQTVKGPNKTSNEMQSAQSEG